MPKFLAPFVANAPYAFEAVGLVWLAIAVLAGSALVLWPVVACIAAGIMLRQWPSARLTWAWVVASASMGFLLSAYLVYEWLSFLGGAFSSLAAVSTVGFVIFAVAHALLFYAGIAKPAASAAAV